MSNYRISRTRGKASLRGDWHALWPVWALCTVLLLFGVFVVVMEYRAGLPQKSDIPVVVLKEGQDLHLDRSKLSSSQLRLFEANASGQRAKFIVQQTGDRIVHVAVASCRACYRNRDSHYVRKGEIICGLCKKAMIFDANGQMVSTDHCALVKAHHVESDREVTVLARDVLAQAAKLPQ